MSEKTISAQAGFQPMRRIWGMALLLRAVLPLVVVGLVVLGMTIVAYSVDRAVNSVKQDVAAKMAAIDTAIGSIKAEGQRLYDEINRIKNQTAEMTEDIKRSVEPIRKSLLGIAGVVRTISKTVEKIMNAVIRVLNAVPMTKNIRLINLPDIKVPGLKLPAIHLDVDLEPDLRAVRELQQQAMAAAEQIKAAVEDILAVFSRLWLLAKTILVLALVWLGLAIVGIFGRMQYRLQMALRLMRGQPVEGVWQAF